MNAMHRCEAIGLLRKAGCQQNVIEHCMAVSSLAVEIAQACKRNGAKVDVQLVEIGAILHDIGRSVTHGVEHGVVGARILQHYGVPPEVRNIVERHVGAGLTEDDARELGLPSGDYVPKTLEEKIVAYSDKLIDGDRRVPLNETLGKYAIELGRDHPSIGRLKALEAEIVSLTDIP